MKDPDRFLMLIKTGIKKLDVEMYTSPQFIDVRQHSSIGNLWVGTAPAVATVMLNFVNFLS